MPRHESKRMTADEKVDAIHRLLRAKHSKDLVIPECKNGRSYGPTPMRRIDCLVMARSWAHPNFDGYEIKVTRRDFMQDVKWQEYLPMCNRLWFVCPSGLLEPADIPEGAGLMWASKNYAKLYKKKKAVRRDEDVARNTLLYILMCRTVISDEVSQSDMLTRCQEWLAEKNEKKKAGMHVGRVFSDRYRTLARENKHLLAELEKYGEMEKICAEIDVDITRGWGWQHDVKKMIDRAKCGMDATQRNRLEQAVETIQQLLD